MATDGISVFSYIVGLAWDLLGFQMPGLQIDCKTWVLMIVTINITLSACYFVFGLGGSGTGYRSGDSRKKHISKERQGDEY